MTLRPTISITTLFSPPLASAGHDQARHFFWFPHPICHASSPSSAENNARQLSSLANQLPSPSRSTTAVPAAPAKFP
jgi:hypothetical protein